MKIKASLATETYAKKIVEEVKDKKGNVIRRKVMSGGFGPTKTQQGLSERTDINQIMKKYDPSVREKLMMGPQAIQGPIVDLTGIGDYEEAWNKANRGREAFMRLPSAIRNRFENDPEKLIKFLHSKDQKDIDESVALGIRTRVTAPPDPNADLRASTEALRAVTASLNKDKADPAKA